MAYKDPGHGRACDRERYRRRTAERLARGMCPRCGEARPVADHSLCQCCGEKRRQAERARCAKARAAGILYAAETPNGAAGARVTGASGATGHGGRLACARVAQSNSPWKAARSANPAARRGVNASGNNMPRGVQLASAADAVRPPPTAARVANGAPGARPNPQGRRRRTPEAAGVTSGAGCEGFA